MLMPPKKRVLVIPPLTGESVECAAWLAAADYDISQASDSVTGVARAVAETPDIVVVAGGANLVESLALCQQIVRYLPADRMPTFVVGPSPESVHGTLIGLRANTTRDPARTGDMGHVTGSDVASSGGEIDGVNWLLEYQGLRMDRRRFRATVDRRELHFTATEFSVLWVMVAQPGHVKTRKQLVEACRGAACVLGRRTMDQHIRSIRYKLRDRADMVETVRGVGYRVREVAVRAV